MFHRFRDVKHKNTNLWITFPAAVTVSTATDSVDAKVSDGEVPLTSAFSTFPAACACGLPHPTPDKRNTLIEMSVSAFILEDQKRYPGEIEQRSEVSKPREGAGVEEEDSGLRSLILPWLERRGVSYINSRPPGLKGGRDFDSRPRAERQLFLTWKMWLASEVSDWCRVSREPVKLKKGVGFRNAIFRPGPGASGVWKLSSSKLF